VTQLTVTFGNFYIFKIWNLQVQPALLIGMDMIGTLDTFGVDYLRREVQMKVTGPGSAAARAKARASALASHESRPSESTTGTSPDCPANTDRVACLQLYTGVHLCLLPHLAIIQRDDGLAPQLVGDGGYAVGQLVQLGWLSGSTVLLALQLGIEPESLLGVRMGAAAARRTATLSRGCRIRTPREPGPLPELPVIATEPAGVIRLGGAGMHTSDYSLQIIRVRRRRCAPRAHRKPRSRTGF